MRDAKPCITCETPNRTASLRCPKCEYRAHAENRTCERCSKSFKGILRKGGIALCNACYRPGKSKQRTIEQQQVRRSKTRSTCSGCLKEFKGQGTKCPACSHKTRATPKICIACGKTYQRALAPGGVSLCAACRLTPEQKQHRIDLVVRRQILKKGASEAEYDLSWRSLWAQGIYYCAYCGVRCDPDDKQYGHIGPTYPTIDHVTPLSLGGAHTRANSVLACFTCNARKGARPLIEGGKA